MKAKFSNFYSNQTIDNTELKRIWSSKDTIFIFDTNTLLDLYRYRKETQNEFFKQLENIKSNIWMPYHVGLEFHNNRLKVIKQNKDKNKEVDSLKELISIDLKQLSTFQDKYKKTEHPELYEKIEELKSFLKEKKKEVEISIEPIKKQMKELLSIDNNLEPHFLAHKDKIIEKISTLFNDDKIGNNLYESQESIDELFETAKQRWAKEIPPGYLDYHEKQDKHFFYDNLKYYNALGDLIIFNEIINISKNKNHILFISNDTKSDWKMNIDYEGKKDLGIRPELKNELIRTNPHITFFEILTTEQFIENANKINGKVVNKEIMQDVKHINDWIKAYNTKPIENLAELSNNHYFEINRYTSQQDRLSQIESILIQLNNKNSTLHQEIIELETHLEENRSRLHKYTEKYLDSKQNTRSPSYYAIQSRITHIQDRIEMKQQEKLKIEKKISSLTSDYFILQEMMSLS